VVGRVRASTFAAVASAAPGCILAIASVVSLALAIVDAHPMWPHEPLNISEAASVDDEAEVVRLIERGEDPDGRRPVRAGLLGGSSVHVTPLEAAVAAKNPSVIATLLANGATLDAIGWNDLRCRADDKEVALMLEAHRPAGATVRCDDGNSGKP
jgi:hypothetical protein